ncbi:CBU_0592 family membrane protein [Metallibacterium scheffleri]
MTLQWFDWVGFAGVALIVVAYFLVQAGRLRGDSMSNQVLNALGALAVMVSLVFGTFNFPAFVLEAIWLAVSVYGMVWGARRRHRSRMFR